MEVTEAEAEDEDEEMDGEEYDASSYQFAEHQAPARQSKSLTEAHMKIGLLQSWNKKHDKLLSKCW